MPLSGEHVAAALAERFQAIVPPPFAVSAHGSILRAEHPRGTWFEMGCEWDDDDERSPAHLLELTVDNALNHVQDLVSEVSTEPWPPLDRAALERAGLSRAMAPYHTAWRGSELHFWYGVTEREAVIAFAPIALDSVEGPSR